MKTLKRMNKTVWIGYADKMPSKEWRWIGFADKMTSKEWHQFCSCFRRNEGSKKGMRIVKREYKGSDGLPSPINCRDRGCPYDS